MRAVNRNSWFVWAAAGGVLLVALSWQREAAEQLEDSSLVSGYVLFGLILFLASYNWRKKLSMLPAGSAANWLTLHVVFGLLAVALFWLHSGGMWPEGFIDQCLAASFYLVCASGIAGYLVQVTVPRRLVQAEHETIFERIPAELAEIRGQAERAVLAAAEASGNETLGRYYQETLSWFFQRPRFLRSHVLGGRRAEQWLKRQASTIDRYLSDAERPHLARLAELGRLKIGLDAQYALQSLLKRWPLAHVPLSVAMIALALWHLLLVNVYAR